MVDLKILEKAPVTRLHPVASVASLVSTTHSGWISVKCRLHVELVGERLTRFL